MSANVSALNLAVSGSTALNGSVTLSAPLLSSAGGNFQGVSTTDLTTSGTVIHDVLPICNVVPTLSNNLINKAYADTKNTSQDARMTAIEAVDVVQDSRILPLETKTTNISFTGNRTTIAGVSTAVGIMTHTVPPVSATLPTGLTQVANKQYVDNNIQIVNNSILVTNNAATALTTRVGTVETKLTNITYTAGSGTTNVAGQTAFLNSPTISNSTSVLATAIKPKSYIDAQDLIATNAITAIQTVNTTQNTNITALQQKTTPIVYVTPQPVAGPMTQLTSSLDLLPYTSATILKAFTLSCTALLCTVQATFGGVGANRGITTSQLQVGGFGNAFQTVYVGSVTSVVGTSNLVTFATPLTGNFPKIFLQAVNGTVTLTNKTLAGFTFSATSVVNVDYWVVQLV